MAFRTLQLISLFLVVSNVNGQFGEIASIVTGLLGSGAGLGSLAGTAGTAGLAGASGAAAGANALGSFGQLYQLAQAALQLTGTGVGIVNQASESAWFPAAIENVARTNREFQDRLLAGQNGKTGTKTSSGGLGGGLPDLFPGLPKPAGQGSVTSIGGKPSEIGTEFGKELSSHETEETTDLKPISEIGETSTTEVPQGTGSGGLQSLFGGQRVLLPGEVGPEESSKNEIKDGDASSGSPTITVQLPKSDRKPQLEFSTDSGEDPSHLLPPPRATPVEEETVVDVDGKKMSIPQMVPELRKLLAALHQSNLTAEELVELTKQLEGNKNIGEPRENTTPEPREPKTPARTKSPAEQAATDRNLLALRRALSSPTVTSNTIRRLSDNQDSPPVVISLPKPTISSSTNVKLPAQKQLADNVETTQTPLVQVATVPKSTTKQQAKPKPVRESMVDNDVKMHRNQANKETKARTRIVTPATTLLTTTVPPATTTSYEQFYRQYYAQYYQNQGQNPQAQIYNFYAQNPFGQLFYQNNPQQYGQSNYNVQRPIAQNQQQHYNGQFQQYYTGNQQQVPHQQYYTTNQQQRVPYYPVRMIANPVPTTPPSKLQHPLASGSLLTLAQSRDQHLGK